MVGQLIERAARNASDVVGHIGPIGMQPAVQAVIDTITDTTRDDVKMALARAMHGYISSHGCEDAFSDIEARMVEWAECAMHGMRAILQQRRLGEAQAGKDEGGTGL